MLPILIPLAAVGALVALATNKPSAQTSHRVAGNPAARVSALETFSAFVQQKLPVPARVLELAAAEALQLGDPALAEAIRNFGAPRALPVQPPTPVAPTQAEPQAAAGVPVAALAPSPISGVADEQWATFTEMLAIGDDGAPRPATYNTKKRIGRYAAAKTRLVQIGIDPDTLAGSADAQDAALAADLAEVHGHLVESGTITEHVGKLIELPNVEVEHAITLSGLLGVVSVAGLEGTVNWLTNASDRQRFPHNTNLFLRCNGAF
jgi:hypothetical protein